MAFSWNAADYAEQSSAQLRWAEELIEKLELRPGQTLLDIGSGDGKITAALAAQLVDGAVVGIDHSQEMVAYAKEKHAALKNLSFQQMDARKIAFKQKFDIVFSNATLHWVDDHRAVLKGVKRVLAKKGRLMLQMGGRGNATDVLERLDRLLKDPAWQPYFADLKTPYHFPDVTNYVMWLAEAGLIPHRVELIDKEMRHDNREGLIGWIRTTWLPYTERIPSKERERFISTLVDAYLEEHPLDDVGRTCVKMVRLEVEAGLTAK